MFHDAHHSFWPRYPGAAKTKKREVKHGRDRQKELSANKWGDKNIRCAAISLAAGLLMQNYLIVIDVALVVGLALGIQIAKSRACAVLLLVYSCINTIIMSISYKRVSGWWLIFVGIWAVMGTFNFHKDYRKYRLERQ